MCRRQITPLTLRTLSTLFPTSAPALRFLPRASRRPAPPFRPWCDFRNPLGQDVGSVLEHCGGKNKGSLRQVNEARRQLCAKLHQYSTEASLPRSLNNIPVIWVSRITVLLRRGAHTQTGRHSLIEIKLY